MERLQGLGTATIGFLALIFGIVFSVLLGGLIVPVVRQHCVDTGGGIGSFPTALIDTSWHWDLSIPPGGDVISGGQLCVRNTPTSELLSVIGIRSLPDPRTQIANAASGQVGDYLGNRAGDYVRGLYAVQRKDQPESEAAANGFINAQTTGELKSAAERLRRSLHTTLDDLEKLSPPAQLQTLQNLALGFMRQAVAASDDLVTAIDSGDRQAAIAAYRRLVAASRQAQQKANELRQEAGSSG